MKDLNVFDGYMPGGGFIKFHAQWGTEPKPEQKRLLDAIDAYVAQTRFDMARYSRLRNIADKADTRFHELLQAEVPSTSERVRAVEYVSQRVSELMYEMHKPVYDHMLTLGFEDSLLRGNPI